MYRFFLGFRRGASVLSSILVALLVGAGGVACQTGESGQRDDGIESTPVRTAEIGVAAGWSGSAPYPGFCAKTGDPNADEEAEWTLTRGYDAEGRVTVEVYDHMADGTPDSRFEYRYNAAGLQTKKIKYVSDQQHPVRVVTYAYESDNQTEASFDMDGDGSAERLVKQAFDDQGRRVRRSVDHGADGQVDAVWRYDYENGRLAVERWDQDGDGKIEEVTRYEYDDAGQLIAEKLDIGVDGTFEQVVRYRRDDKGRVVERSLDKGADGQPEERVVIEYASGDRRSSVRVDADGDGAFERETAYEYDRHGQLLREETDQRADGTVDAVITYSYDCWPS